MHIIRQERTPMQYSRYLRFLERSRARRRESILFCQHEPVITSGLQSQAQNLLQAVDSLARQGIEFHQIRRGGDHTAHEPGQLLIYVHLDFKKRGLQLGPFFDSLLQIAAQSIVQTWDLTLQTRPGAPGLYDTDGRKVLSIGLDVRRGFSGHGLALNIDNNLGTFRHIHPCGYADLQVASIGQLGGDPLLRAQWIESFCQRLIAALSFDSQVKREHS
ncbi:MAG: lipoyl(octanoyl) transferase LipB [Leptospiraceae bacterium]|nr:lipoyl(octanoyl) transferase LipB [Leptospiraceae bacterium]